MSVPVIVVGNIILGGTGKTPFVIWLCQDLKSKGYTPGILMRGYGLKTLPKLLIIDEHTYQRDNLYPDEAHLCWLKTHVPIAISKNRVEAGRKLIEKHHCNIIISDDGLQHYQLVRHYEIAVIDAVQGFGNTYLLPLGPLREPPSRLNSVNAIVVYQKSKTSQKSYLSFLKKKLSHHIPIYSVYLKVEKIIHLMSKTEVSMDFFNQKKIYAIAGIGHPEKFFKTLKDIGIKNFIPVPFPDHYLYQEKDFLPFNDGEIIMTDKDAVKCFNFLQENFFTLPVSVAFLNNKLFKLET